MAVNVYFVDSVPWPKGLSNYFDEGKSECSSLTGISDEEIRDMKDELLIVDDAI